MSLDIALDLLWMAQLFETGKWKSHNGYGNSKTESCLVLVTKCMAQWRMEKQITYGNSTMTNFMAGCSKSPNASTDLPGRQVRSQVRLVAPGAPPDARFAGKSIALLNNLLHCYQTKI